MLGDGNTEGVSAQMSDVAKKFHGGFGITDFEFRGGGAHATECLDLAARTNGLALARGLANFAEMPIPAFLEARATQVIAFLMGDHTDGHAAGRTNSTTVQAAAAGIFPGTQGAVLRSKFVLDQLEIFRFASRITEFQIDGLLGRKPHRQWAL